LDFKVFLTNKISSAMQYKNNLTRNQVIASAAGTLEVLEAISKLGVPSSLGSIISATGRPKGTVHRMVSTLVNTDFVRQDEAGRYFLTLKAWRIGSVAVQALDIADKGRPILSKLGSETGETVHLAVLDPSGGVVYVSKVESPKSISVQTRLGQINPSWCTATGRSIIAFNTLVAQKVLSKKLEKFTNKTIASPAKIKELLDQVRVNGFAVTLAENHPEMGGIAAPIRDHTGGVVASCGVAIPAFRMNAELIDRFIPLVVNAANTISNLLGYTATLIDEEISHA
jgi:DNA-binding IclR family transcriptional regulator